MRVERYKRWAFSQVFREANGQLSSSRVLMFAWGGMALALWTAMSINRGELAPIPQELVWLVLGLSGAKAAQKFGEQPAANEQQELS